MKHMIVDSSVGVTLAGGGPFGRRLLNLACVFAPHVVAADGGADRLLRLGVEPEAVIGDLDSIGAKAKQRLAGRLHSIDEQETTDFDKALRSIRAPVIIGVGFIGGRSDHGLAVLNALLRHADRPCCILGPRDLCFLAPARFKLDLPAGSLLSLFPMGAVTGKSEGLRWPIAGINFAPDGNIGTSNQVTGPVHLEFDAPKMLVMVPIKSLGTVIDAIARQ
jgi:thiamine pyrophosphokinase